MILEKKNFAISKYCRVSSPKISKILDKIRGKSYENAIKILSIIPQRGGLAVWKLIHSAASNNFKIDKKDLFIAFAWSNRASILKRLQPRARGKAYRIEKKLSHITLILAKK